ncbi:MAG: tetratricopeptide repeat protein [Bacteroidota bacterium]
MKHTAQFLKVIIACCVFLFFNNAYTQNVYLEKKIDNITNDQQLLSCLESIDSLIFSNPDEAILYSELLLKKQEKKTSELNLAKISTYLAKAKNANDIDVTETIKKVLPIFIKNKTRDFEALVYILQADLADDENDFENALNKALDANRIYSELKNNLGIARSYLMMGHIYSELRQYKKAEETYLQAADLYKNDIRYLGRVYHSLGDVYEYKNNLKIAFDYFLKALEIKKKYDNKHNLGRLYAAIGSYYTQVKNYDKSFEYYNKTYIIEKELGSKYGMASALNNMSISFYFKKDYATCEKYLLQTLALVKDIDDVDFAQKTYENLAEISRVRGNYEDALGYMEESLNYQDTILSKRFKNNIAEMQAKFDVEKAHEKTENEKMLRAADNKTAKYVIITIALLVILMSVVAIFLYKQSTLRKYANARLEIQKQQIEIKNHEIELKNKDITDSIKYAKHIQEAIVPPNEFIQKFLPQSFVLYLPKDIVAGDFYWVDDQINENNDLLVYFAVVDCTGHGVPGAMMSVVGANGLYRCVDEFSLREPAAILDKLTAIVEDGFKRGGNVINDGMDISIGRLNLGNGKKNSYELTWSGANNPLWIIKKNGEFIEIIADKQPIGKFEHRKPFTQHNLIVEKGDSLYLFTDGYADQFGGPKGKKMKYAKLKQLLIEVKELDTEIQKNKIHTFFNEWRADLEQVDDVCVMGIKV